MKTARTTIRLLRQFTVGEALLGVTELARKLDMDKASVHRLLKTLTEEHIVEQDIATRRYRLGLGILQLAATRLAQFGVIKVAVPHMEQLRDKTGESVALLARNGHEMVCIHTVESLQPVRLSYTLGERAPVHSAASGLVCLAEMPEAERRDLIARSRAAFPHSAVIEPAKLESLLAQVRREECAVSDKMYPSHVRAAAAPVRDAAGRLVCALAVAAPIHRIAMRELWTRARLVRQVAMRIGHDLGAPGNLSGPMSVGKASHH